MKKSQPLFPAPGAEQAPQPESRKLSESVWVQFSDGDVALGHNKAGKTVLWTKPSKWESISSPGNIALVSLKSGRSIAFSFNGAVELPGFNKQAGTFGDGTEDITILETDPYDLPDLTIGEACPELFGADEEVKSVMFQYKSYAGTVIHNAEQLPFPSPFEAIREDDRLTTLF